MIQPWFFSQKMRRVKLYKTPIKNVLLNGSSGFAIDRMNNIHSSVTSQRSTHKNMY